MSLDGYIGSAGDGLTSHGGDGVHRLHGWSGNAEQELVRPSGPAGERVDEINATGAGRDLCG